MSAFSTTIGYIRGKVLDVSSARLTMAIDIVTSRPRCLFVQRRPKMGNDSGGLFKVITLAPTTGWKLTN